MQKFFTDVFEGVLITDFRPACESVCAEERHYCLVHLLRDGIRLRKRPDFTLEAYRGRVDRLNQRCAQLQPLLDTDIADG